MIYTQVSGVPLSRRRERLVVYLISLSHDDPTLFAAVPDDSHDVTDAQRQALHILHAELVARKLLSPMAVGRYKWDDRLFNLRVLIGEARRRRVTAIPAGTPVTGRGR